MFFPSHSPHLLSQGAVVLIFVWVDDESSADSESQGCESYYLLRVELRGVGTPFLQDIPVGCLAGFLKCLLVGDLRAIPHLVVCGLFNRHTHGARHISVGCLDLLLVVGCSAPLGAVHSLASFSLSD